MKVALLKSYFLWPYATGGERSQTSTIAALNRMGNDVIIRYAIPPGLPNEVYEKFRMLIHRFTLRVRDEGKRYISYEAEGIPIQATPVSGPPAAWVGEWLDELQPDFVCASAKDTYFLPILTAFWPGPGVIFIEDLASIELMLKRLSSESRARLKGEGWTFIASSNFLRGKMKDMLDINSKVLYPVTPLSPSLTPIPDSGPLIMFGTDEGKGIDIFRRIARKCIKHRFGVICGWERASLPPDDIVEYLPFQLRADTLLQRSRAVVVPSRYEEGFGRVAFEAMAFGRPVITSDQGALPEVIAEAGVIVPIPTDISSTDEWERAVHLVTDCEKAQEYATAGLKRSREIIQIRNRQFEEIFGVSPSSVS